MTTVILRANKGTGLTNAEIDANFNNLNTDKAEVSNPVFTGNVGVGITPSAWDSTAKALQFSVGAFSSSVGLGTVTTLNGYYSGGWRYQTSAGAMLYSQVGAGHRWSVAPAGTAGSVIPFTQAMTLDASGNLLVGTTSAEGRIVANGRLQVGALGQTNNSFGLAICPVTAADAVYNLASINNSLIISTGSNVNQTLNVEVMRIDPSGNLGLGTTTPGTKLHISGSGNTARSRCSSTDVGGVVVEMLADGATAGVLSVNTAKPLVFQTNSAERMRLDSSGNLALGTATALARHTVYDSSSSASTWSHVVKSAITANNLLAVRSDGHVQMEYTYNSLTSASAANMVIGSGGWIYRSTSSAKYKRDVKTAAYGLTEVMKLRPVTYRGKNTSDGEKVFGGLIAEEVHAANLSEFVAYNENNEPDALHYGHMVSLLVAAMQEQQAIIVDLRSRVTALENK